MSRAVARQISFADFELMRQGVRLEPWRRSADSKRSIKMRKFTLVSVTATMASLFAQTSTATSRTTASADPKGVSSMPSSILSFLQDTLIALF
jgi:hypothetical protein